MEHEYRIGDLISPWKAQNRYLPDPWPDRVETLKSHLQGKDLEAYRESNNLYIHFIPEIMSLSPASKIILLMRSKADFIKSAIKRGWHNRTIFSLMPEEGWQVGTSAEEKAAWIYEWRNGIAFDALARVNPDAWMVVATHDIYSRADEMASFYGVPYDKAILEQGRKWAKS
jgi:hypothetical protein